PLNAIIGFADLMRSDRFGPLDEGRRRDYCRLIHASGQHLLELVNTVLDTASIEAGEVELASEALALETVIDDCVAMLRPQADERGVLLVKQVPPGLPPIMADRRACRQMLINLICNAVKFSHRDGTVVLGLRREADALSLFVRDSGIGIPASELPRLGAPFVQAAQPEESRLQGSGLGLSVVKGLAALHGGSVR